jgi:hypothetical protein
VAFLARVMLSSLPWEDVAPVPRAQYARILQTQALNPCSFSGAKGGKPWHFAAGISCFCFLLVVAGVVILPIGMGQHSTANQFVPDEDFITSAKNTAGNDDSRT